MYIADAAVVGTGPAGISAAINLAIRKKSFYLLGSSKLSDRIQRSEKIDNYPGMPGITGAEFNSSLKKHLEKLEIPITEAQVTGIYNFDGYYGILADKEQYYARTVIIATGVEAVKPVPGEREFLGRGVSYCATCDGRLYKDRNIAVVCDNETMEHETDYLAELADKIYFVPRYKTDYTRDNVVRIDGPVKKIKGNDVVQSIVYGNGEELAVDGVFFLKHAVAADVLLKGLTIDNGRIVTDRNMSTGLPGCFAAGDCTGAPYQIAKAAGEGNIAAHSAISYLAGTGKGNND
ncbi:MAG: NAD(P)/FAD-dependent oxidoreductase [Butyrivibrio sp.]